MRWIPPVAAVVAAFLLAPAASAHRYDVRIGLGDQNTPMFDAPDFQRLKLRQVRYFVDYNAIHERDERLRMRAWVKRARAAGMRPLLHVSTDNLEAKKGALPSVAHYRRDVGRLVRYLRRLGVRDFGVWNEANHKTQPTWNHPRQAARYFKEMHRAVHRGCSLRSCRVVALDVLDQRGDERYIRRWYGALSRTWRKRVRVVGVHNYSDANRKRTTGLRGIVSTVHDYGRPNIWLTETGGVVKFGRSFPCSESRAADRLDYLFRTIRNWRRHLQRVYLYNWTGTDCQTRMDVGIAHPNGVGREEPYRVVRRWLRHFKR